jgi:hypothetical protein
MNCRFFVLLWEIQAHKRRQRSDSKEKIGNAINRLDLLHRLFINHGDYGGSSRALGIRDDLLVVWRGMEDPPPKLP